MAQTPITFVLVNLAADLIIGSIPINFCPGYFARNVSIAYAVAVLQAMTTTSLLVSSGCKALSVREIISSLEREPYGTCALSLTDVILAFGKDFLSSIASASPPIPESKTPILTLLEYIRIR